MTDKSNTQAALSWAEQLDPIQVSTSCSPKHVQSVLEQAVGFIVQLAAQPTPEARALASITVDPKPGTVLVYVVGQTGSGKSGVAGEIEIAMKALGLDVEWPAGVAEKNMTGADWQTALELYRPRVVIHEINVVNGVAHG